MRPHSGIPKKVREANLRRQRSKERKFNEPLRIFFERRHPNILIEFGQLYDWLDQQNPNRKSLINTDAFKQWMFHNPLPSPNFSTPPTPTRLPMCSPPVQQIDNPLSSTNFSIPPMPTCLPSPPVKPKQFSLPHLEIPLLSASQLSQYSSPSAHTDEDILGTTFRKVFGSVEPISLKEVDVPEAIVNELMENEFLRELLSSEEAELPELRGLLEEELNVDEGIELNHLDEIAEDIEPFDFEECELF